MPGTCSTVGLDGAEEKVSIVTPRQSRNALLICGCVFDVCVAGPGARPGQAAPHLRDCAHEEADSPLVDWQCEGPRGDWWLKDDGWVQVTTRGSHRHFKHPSKPGRVTVSGALGDDMPKGTLASVLRQAGLKRGEK